MKKIILIASMLLLTSCAKYWYNVNYTTCSWEKGNTYTEILQQNDGPYISTYKQAVPILMLGNKRILNVCEFAIINKTEIQ